MMMLIGPRHSGGAHDSRAPLEGRAPMKVCCFSRSPGSVDSWTPGPKPLCHRHPTGPHPSGLLWTPWPPARGDSTKSNFALTAERRDLRQEGAFGGDRRQAGLAGPGIEAAVGVLGVVGLVEIVREEIEQAVPGRQVAALDRIDDHHEA